MSFPAERNESGRRPIASLLGLRRPLAIFLAIISVIIFTLKLVMWRWSLSHIFVEFTEIIPFWAYGNSAPTISRIKFFARIIASFTHTFPNLVLRHLFGLTVLSSGIAQSYSTKMAARTSMAGKQAIAGYDFFLPTIAKTFNEMKGAIWPALNKRLTNDRQAAEPRIYHFCAHWRSLAHN